MGTTTEKLTYLQGTKDAIKNAIVTKGVEVPKGTTFRAYAEKVGEIQTGGGEPFEIEVVFEKSTGRNGNAAMGFYDSNGGEVALTESTTVKKSVNPGTVIMFWVERSDALAIELNGEDIENKMLVAARVGYSIYYYYGITVDKAQKIEFSVTN